MKRRLKELTILIAILAMGGAIAITTGVVPIRASDRHWAVTRWFLDFASNRSVAFHSLPIETPTLDEPGMLELGAATYESNCRWCHGRPGHEMQPVASGMTPAPPYLTDAAQSHGSAELFYIVKHGIKFAGMPAWPTQRRDEEVWPVIAFLMQLPNLDAEQYQSLVTVDAQMADSAVITEIERFVVEQCAVCHGVAGRNNISPRVPVLAGQSEEYLKLSLLAYKNAERYSGVMQPFAARLTDDAIGQLANYFASQEMKEPAAGDTSSGIWKQGEKLAHNGNQKDKIPSCVDCHGPGPDLRSEAYPRLAGQPAWYVERQLQLFSNRHRGGSKHASLMHPIADKLSPSQRTALAEYFSQPAP